MESSPRILAVAPRENMVLVVEFLNGEKRAYDCKPLLARPEFQLLAIPAFFKTVQVDPGGYGISWNDILDLSEYELWTRGNPVDDADLGVPSV